MRDFLLSGALKRLATEAATRLSTMVAEGDEIPFDVATEGAEEMPFFSYVPLTGTYVVAHAEELRSLPGFAPAREAVAEDGVAAAYLEARGEVVPADPGERAELMLTHFLAELWDGSAGFALDPQRLEDSISLLGAETRDADEAEVLIVPLVGLRMSAQRLQLPHGVRLVRADSIDAPVDAMRSEGMGRAAWEPQLLAVAEQDPGGGAESALRQLHELISVMRLFKAGGVGLGPYAFAPTGEQTWRRISTGAPATRPGGYRLSEDEAAELAAFAAELESRPDPDSALTWAVGRFEMGCERESSLDGLSDHLLALRAVLEGHGPVGASLPMRAAALIDSNDRIAARERVEETLELERELMNGRSLTNALEVAAWAEEGVRRLLRQAALGELGEDLIGVADETLIANGLAEGDAQISVAAELELVEEPPVDELRIDEAELEEDGEAAEVEPVSAEEEQVPFDEVPEFEFDAERAEPIEPPAFDQEPIEVSAETQLPSFAEIEAGLEEEGEVSPDETRILEPIPAEDEIKITATPWLDEVSDARPGDSLEWPAPAYDSESDRDIQHRERIDTPRVRHLFPVPDSDWDVSNLEFDYNRNAR